MIIKVDKQYTYKEWQALPTEEKINALRTLGTRYISKFNETKKKYLLTRAKQCAYRANLMQAVDAGLQRSRAYKHYEKGDYQEYLDDIKRELNQLVLVALRLCRKSAEHGYYFDPSKMSAYWAVKLGTLQAIPNSGWTAEEADESAVEDSADAVPGGLLFE